MSVGARRCYLVAGCEWEVGKVFTAGCPPPEQGRHQLMEGPVAGKSYRRLLEC